MPFWGGRGGEYGVRTPVEKREETEIGPKTDLWMVLGQAFFLAVAAAMAAGASILAVAKMGEATFWLVAFVFGAASFFWVLRQAHKYEVGPYRWSEFAVADITIAAIFMLFSGFLSWCLHRTTMLFLGDDASSSAIWSLLLFVWSLVFFIGVGVAFFQELAQRSPFQEQNVWEAVGSHLRKPKQPEPGEPEEIRHVVEATIIRQTANGAQLSRSRGNIPANDLQLQQLWRHIQSELGEGERALGGNGRIFDSIPKWRDARDALMDLGILVWRDPDYHRQGWEVTDEGEVWFEQLEAQNTAPPR